MTTPRALSLLTALGCAVGLAACFSLTDGREGDQLAGGLAHTMAADDDSDDDDDALGGSGSSSDDSSEDGSSGIPGAPSVGQGEGLYGHDNVNSTIIRIDPTTGAATLVGPTGFRSNSSGLATSLAEVQGPAGPIPAGTVFGLLLDLDAREDFVVTIDTTTGEATKIVQTQRRIGGRGISFGPGADGGTLFLIEGTLMSTIDVATGAVSPIGSLPASFDSVSLDLDRRTGEFLAVERGLRLIQIPPADPAAVQVIAPLSPVISACTLSQSLVDGSLYSVELNSAQLVRVGDDGAVSVIGPLGAASSFAVCGSAFACLPRAADGSSDDSSDDSGSSSADSDSDSDSADDLTYCFVDLMPDDGSSDDSSEDSSSD